MVRVPFFWESLKKKKKKKKKKYLGVFFVIHI